MAHGRMTVVAHDPQVHVVPSSRALGPVAYPRCSLIHYAKGFLHDWRFVPCRMRRLVDPRESRKHEIRSLPMNLLGYFGADVAVDRQPAIHVSTKMSLRRAGIESHPA